MREKKKNRQKGVFMAQINVSNLTFGYEGSYDTIFENVSFSIDTSWKLGFVGRNVPRYILKV